MVNLMPTRDQWLRCKSLLRDCADDIQIHMMKTTGTANNSADLNSALKNLQFAATALGYELVQRTTPAARDGGRMDCEVDEHA